MGNTLLYFYGAVCASMLAFNLIYSLITRRGDLRAERRVRKARSLLEIQLRRLAAGAPVEGWYLKWLQWRLRRVSGLASFYQAAEDRLRDLETAEVAAYRRAIQPVILRTAVIYSGRDAMQAAYFAYFLSRYCVEREKQMDALQDILVQYMRRDNLYCRVNALEALYTFGTVENVARAVVLLDQEGGFVHEKVLTDGLLSYTGDHRRLIELLWRDFDTLRPKTQLSILNYIRFHSGDYCAEMLSILTDPEREKELRLSAIRYFGRYVYPPARESLLAMAASRDPERWEYASVSASCLGRYPGEETEKALLEAVHNANWYVRSSAAGSLADLGLDYQTLVRMVGAGDRYAREMLIYQLNRRRPKAEGAERTDPAATEKPGNITSCLSVRK